MTFGRVVGWVGGVEGAVMTSGRVVGLGKEREGW